ncbi:MAG: response regulator [Myxococcales bacterium]
MSQLDGPEGLDSSPGTDSRVGWTPAVVESSGRHDTPRSHPALPAVERPKPQPHSALRRVLVVEDTPTQSKYLSMLLEQHGYSVGTATNGREGLACLERERFPVVITDWLMPQMDGLEFCRAVRALKSESYVYIILVTAQDTKDHIVKGLEAGADEYLVKPVHPAELVARLNTAMRILKLETALRERTRQIELLSNTDALTETFNRRYLGVRLGLEIRRCVRYGRPLSVVMCDLDRFKLVNDEHGHLTGDSVLTAFAQALKASMRDQIDLGGALWRRGVRHRAARDRGLRRLRCRRAVPQGDRGDRGDGPQRRFVEGHRQLRRSDHHSRGVPRARALGGRAVGRRRQAPLRGQAGRAQPDGGRGCSLTRSAARLSCCSKVHQSAPCSPRAWSPHRAQQSPRAHASMRRPSGVKYNRPIALAGLGARSPQRVWAEPIDARGGGSWLSSGGAAFGSLETPSYVAPYLPYCVRRTFLPASRPASLFVVLLHQVTVPSGFHSHS